MKLKSKITQNIVLLLYFSFWAVNLELGQANTSKLAATFSEPHRKDFIVVI